ncbi:hypothetical protein PM082_019377 [Marasmius tenuissimus]|nr:hypothetical protein PM082_019377 [Marasmius tenuissimus]
MSRRLRSQVQVIVPRLADLPEYRDVEAWLLFEGPSPGVYSYDPCGKFARAYQDYDQARRDYARYQDCGLIELMNRPLPEDYTWISALVMGLKWDFGTFDIFPSEKAARNHFYKEFGLGNVRTKVVTTETIPQLMFPKEKVTWIVEGKEGRKQ